jgi:hypothetical protein
MIIDPLNLKIVLFLLFFITHYAHLFAIDFFFFLHHS